MRARSRGGTAERRRALATITTTPSSCTIGSTGYGSTRRRPTAIVGNATSVVPARSAAPARPAANPPPRNQHSTSPATVTIANIPMMACDATAVASASAPTTSRIGLRSGSRQNARPIAAGTNAVERPCM